MSSTIPFESFEGGFKPYKLQLTADNKLESYRIIVGAQSDISIKIDGVLSNPVIVSTCEFDNEGDGVYTTLETISTVGTTKITTSDADNYIKLSSNDLVVGEITIQIIVKKKK